MVLAPKQIGSAGTGLAGVFGITVIDIVLVAKHKSGAVPFEPSTVNTVLMEGLAFTWLPVEALKSAEGDHV